jgi:SSS family solute:Na+ symporter
MNLNLTVLDATIFAIYILGVFALGIYASRKAQEISFPGG